MKHKLTLIIVLLLVLSSIVYAAEETESSPCDGFFGSLKCFFVGNADNRAGMSWFDRSSNLVGQAGGPFVVCSADKINIGDKCVTKNEVGKPLVNSLSLKKGDVLMDKDGVKFKVDSVNPETGVITLDSASTIGSDNIQMFKLKEFSSEPIPVTSSSAATENPPTSVPPSTPIKTVSITTEPSNLEEITICSESKGGLCKEEVGYDTKVFYKEGGNYGKIYPVTSIKGTDVTYDKSKTKDEAIGFTAAKNPKSPAPASSAQPATTSSPNAAVNTPPNNVPTNARIEVQNGKTYWVDTSKIEGNVYDEEGNLVQGLNYDKKGEWSYGEGFEWKNKDPNSNSVEVVAKQGGQSSPGPTQTRAELKAEEPPKEKTALEKYQEKWIKDNCNKDGRPDCSRKDICVGKVVDSKCMVDGKIGDKTKTAISKELKIPKDQIEQVTAGGAEIQEIGPNKIITVIDGKDGNKITRTWEKNGVLGTKITEVKEEKGKPALTTTTFKNSKGALLYTQTTTKDKDNKDVTSVTHANGIAFTPDKNYDKNTGACKKGTACLKATSGEFAGRVHLQASENPYDSVPFTVEQPPSKVGNIKRTLSYQIKDSNDELVEINVQQECSKDCEGGLKTDKKEVGTNILTPDYVDFRTDYTSGVREYNTNQIGLFAHIDRGVGVDCTNFAGVNGCGTTVFFSTDNNLACKTEPCNAQNPTKQSTDTKGWEKNVCGDSCDGPKMIEAISDAHSSKNTQMFFAGQQTWQKAGGQILNGFSGWSSISNALVGDIYANELATDIDRWFAGSILSEDYWESSFCYETASDVQEDGFAFIERPGGLTGTDFMPVAAIQAEMFEEKTPLLCMHNLDKEAEEEFVCPGKLFCNPDDSFCYNKEGDETPVQAFFYKISWGVTAPSDISFTPYGDESSAVEFNLKLGDKRLNDKTIKLKNGETDKNLITHYSDQDYENVQVCIAWVKAPITLNRKAETWDTTHPISDVCYTIKKAEIGTVIFTSDTATESVSVNNGKVTIDSSW